ncbi:MULTISPECIES: DinB family protein [unclassified Micromonospora]|uniref:DinB family protein n=1 Tax=unclassified Micromonospora TaxID=2617518 RepID=UPI003636F7E6
MTPPDAKADLHQYLRDARQALLWKLDGLPEYDIRRPVTPTGTNLLGLVKHLAGVEFGYFGPTFGRPYDESMPFDSDTDPNADMWATADESHEQIVALYRRAWSHADATIEALPLDAIGTVPWWPAGSNRVTLHLVLVHVTAESHRHAGHADIVREMIDGTAGMMQSHDNLPYGDASRWAEHRARVQRAAEQASDG